LEGFKLASDEAAKEAEHYPKGRLGTAADVPRPGQTSKVRLVTMSDLDRRTKAAQIALETKSAIMADLGGEDRLSTLEKIMVENAAMSAAVLRDAHVRWMQGQPVPVSELAILENTFNRTAQALGLSRRAKDVTTIDAYLEQKK
jgi:hypothetical protein